MRKAGGQLLVDVAAQAELVLHAAPDAASRVVAEASSLADLQTPEVAYELPAAVVRERRSGWYRLMHQAAGGGWVAPDQAGTFWPCPEVVTERLSYLTAGWIPACDLEGEPAAWYYSRGC